MLAIERNTPWSFGWRSLLPPIDSTLRFRYRWSLSLGPIIVLRLK